MIKGASEIISVKDKSPETGNGKDGINVRPSLGCIDMMEPRIIIGLKWENKQLCRKISRNW